MSRSLILLCLLLTGCVTIAPPSYTPPQETAPLTGRCLTPPTPTQLPIPTAPEIRDNDLPVSADDKLYIRYLEGLAEELAAYGKTLRDFILNERSISNTVLSQHQRDCH